MLFIQFNADNFSSRHGLNDVNKRDKATLLDYFQSWDNESSLLSYRVLPCSALWGLWLSRNRMIFEGNDFPVGSQKYHLSTSLSLGF